MHLFQSEWLREPPRPARPTYARPVYGTRYARTPSVPATEPAPPVDLRALFPPRLPTPPRRPVASFDRAA